MSTTWRPGPSASVSAASSRATSRWSGTQSRAPRPEARVAAAAVASRAGHDAPGSADQTARGEPPAGSAATKGSAVPVGCPGLPVVRRGRRVRGRRRTARASRSRRAGAGPPAAARRSGCRRSGRRPGRTSRATAGESTGSALTARRSGASRPSCSLRSTRSSTKPSTSCPANRTLTRAPGRTTSCEGGRHQVVERPVEVGQRHVHEHPSDRQRGGRLDRRGLLRGQRGGRPALGVGLPGARPGQLGHQRQLSRPVLRVLVGTALLTHGVSLPAATDDVGWLSTGPRGGPHGGSVGVPVGVPADPGTALHGLRDEPLAVVSGALASRAEPFGVPLEPRGATGGAPRRNGRNPSAQRAEPLGVPVDGAPRSSAPPRMDGTPRRRARRLHRRTGGAHRRTGVRRRVHPPAPRPRKTGASHGSFSMGGTRNPASPGKQQGPEAQTPAAFLSASTRSVRSQVKSGSSRPKWPYAAVCA